MTVSSTTSKVSYSGDGSTTVFAYTYKIFDEDDLTVILRDNTTGTETVQSITTNYTVSGVGASGGGNVTFVTAPASGKTVVIRRESAQTQTTDYVPNDPFPAEAHEDALDKLTFIAQEIQEGLDRAIKISRTNSMTSTEFTVGDTARANKILAFDGDGEIAVTQEIGTYTGNWATSTTYYQRDLIKDTSNDNIYICITAHTSSGSQPISTNTDSAKWALIVDSATASAASASASTSATNAANSASAASTSETNAATSEQNAEDWAVKTDGIVESTDYSSKAWAIGGTGVTDTAGSGPAKDWAVETTGTVDGTEYSAKEYAVGTQIRGSTGSAKDWASYPAGTVDGSEYSAKYWAQQAANETQSQRDVYYGAFANDFAAENWQVNTNGGTVDVGDQYFNNTTNVIKVYDGTVWNDAVVDTSGFATNGFAIAMAIAL